MIRIDLDLRRLGATIVLRRLVILTILVLCSPLISGCLPRALTNPEIPSTLAPRGPGAAEVADLWWLMFWLATAVFVVVAALLLYLVFSRRQRIDNVEPDPHSPGNVQWIWWGGVIVPAIILAVVLFFAIRTNIVLANPPTAPAFTVEIIGHRWWWEVRYPDYQFTTANEIWIPAGQPVLLRLASIDVIHSFWVPELHGKMDLIPGQTNTIWIQADTPGTYRGLCAEFCGLQHAKMQFIVIAAPPDDFTVWAERQRLPAPEPAAEQIRRGQQIFLGSACVYCHTVQGTNATGRLGPDLTHLASRQTLGAGILPNTRGTLGGWISNPQHIKPGNLMPPSDITGEDLQALLDYLMTLQ
ncbi:MAG: cytochrome c oxidase subunit II [Chloroflexi bacterium]|nr:MAG: cytochrome c oxidase subunit II [Chloroflexota bacterium]